MPAEAMRVLVPPALALDTYDGEAWISVVPFKMCDVHPRGLPTVPWLSHFPELNVRTYVTAKDGSRPGVYFFSLDAANPVAVVLARSLFRLPYFHAQMDLIVHGQAASQISGSLSTGEKLPYSEQDDLLSEPAYPSGGGPGDICRQLSADGPAVFRPARHA